MNVIFTCGGTGGHINPAIAVANIWKERHPDSKILFICGEEELERELITKAGYDFVPVHIKGFIRYFDWFCIKYNIKSFFTAWKAVSQCKKILKEFKPEVILGTGGYASFPALMAGAQMGIPTCVHESNAMPGLTTRMLAGKVDKVMVCFQESIKHYKDASKVEVAGMPVRREFIYTEKHSARAQLGLDDKPVIVSAFGSQGAKAMNECMAELFKLEKEAGFPFRHIHAVGSMGWEWMPQLVKEKGIDPDQDKDIQMVEYLYNMPTVMAACDVIISRAGASTCNEIAASGTPCILIPSPNVTDNHQEKNARALCDRGGGVLVLENECTAKRLMEEITALLRDKKRYNNMRKTLQDLTVPDSAERLCAAMEKLIAEKS
jgi:UDP-N-acetylglucosamine--N-acetylmuramyl-(pentapeptide) pyrophosphoryl-undecaprenol N-acetylglucosamine transferase